MFGVGLPVALQCRMTLLPSVTTVLEDELSITAGTITKKQTKAQKSCLQNYAKISSAFESMRQQCYAADSN